MPQRPALAGARARGSVAVHLLSGGRLRATLLTQPCAQRTGPTLC